jgi:hypothetical protein
MLKPSKQKPNIKSELSEKIKEKSNPFQKLLNKNVELESSVFWIPFSTLKLNNAFADMKYQSNMTDFFKMYSLKKECYEIYLE